MEFNPSSHNPNIFAPIRTLHHLSCTGGTLFTKCLAALDHVTVLNEVDPLSPIKLLTGKPQFAPSDIILLARQSWPEMQQDILIDVFLDGLLRLHREFQALGRHLLLRDHSHSHFLTGPSIPVRPSLLEMIGRRFNTLSIVTVRDPVDSFLSLNENRWVQFQPGNFDEYCRRSLAFLDAHADLPLFRYEDFVASPAAVLAQVCLALQLNFSTDFIQKFAQFQFSGDSGRSGDTIEARPRRQISNEFLVAANQSDHYQTLIDRLGYKTINE